MVIVIVTAADMIGRRSGDYNGEPPWPALALFAASSVGIGLVDDTTVWSGKRSLNGITSMPTWFIQLFGPCFFSVAVSVVASLWQLPSTAFDLTRRLPVR